MFDGQLKVVILVHPVCVVRFIYTCVIIVYIVLCSYNDVNIFSQIVLGFAVLFQRFNF